MKHLLVFLFLVALAAPGAFAQSQQQMNRDAEASFTKADAELNRIYAKVLAGLDDESKPELKAAQRAWVAFRDAHAEFQMNYEAHGGSMAPMIYAGVRASLTKARIAQLKELLTNQR